MGVFPRPSLLRLSIVTPLAYLVPYAIVKVIDCKSISQNHRRKGFAWHRDGWP